jgi:diguanylate cyclase (GGDEF)-like protein
MVPVPSGPDADATEPAEPTAHAEPTAEDAAEPTAPAVEEPDADIELPSTGLSPLVLAYLVGPLALAVLVVFRHFNLVADLPVWAYAVAILGSGALSVAVEPWHQAPARSYKRQARLFIHLLAVTAVIYMTGWGPVLVMAYAFIALEETQLWGAELWRPVLAWSLLGIAAGQTLIWFGLAPSFLTRGQAETAGALGAFVLTMVIRMAGATGEKKEQAEALLAHQARHDMLTGLPNRAYFYDVTDAVLRDAATSGVACAVMLFDLDRFKEINDTLGHKYGDSVLTEVGPRVRSVLRSGDILARLGGDEFCVLLPDIDGQRVATQVADRIIDVLEEPFVIAGNSLGIEASCGISMAPTGGASADLMLQWADVAMYVAKASQSRVVVYSEEMSVNTPDRLSLLAELRAAVANRQFVLHYQPKVSLHSGRVEGAEALVRWNHPNRGLLSPDRFIPEAERSGLIEPLTEWVLDTALHQCRCWLDRATSVSGTELSVAVNLSARCLLDASLPGMVRRSLSRWRIAPHLLDLEITETAIMFDPKRARRVLTELSDMGVTLSIDDFGTGYSSLAYLRDLPVKELKIDRSFVQDMRSDADNAVIVRAVVDLARNLRLRTIAEGVENEATWQQLADLGCDSAQGFYLARPMTADLMMDWLRDYADVTVAPTAADRQRSMMTWGGLAVAPD